MEETFVTYLNQFGNAGTIIAVIFVSSGIVLGVYRYVKKLIKIHNDKVQAKVLSDKADVDFHNSMTVVAETVTNIQDSVHSIADIQVNQQKEMNIKMDEIWKAIEEQKNESKSGDNALEKRIKSYEDSISAISSQLEVMDEKQTLLLESDKESIKSAITDEFYKARKNKYIPIHKLQTLESQYEKYLQENGNTFIGELMRELRLMPHDAPEAEERNNSI